MREIVEQIIRERQRDEVFDSHFVIDTIIRNHSDEYLRFAAEHLPQGIVTQHIHAEIAKLISSFADELVVNMGYQSISYNIRGNASECALWRRI